MLPSFRVDAKRAARKLQRGPKIRKSKIPASSLWRNDSLFLTEFRTASNRHSEIKPLDAIFRSFPMNTIPYGID